MFKKLQYINFKISHVTKHWLKRRFTIAGQFVLVTLAIFAMIGLNTYQTVAYQVFSFLFFLVLVSLVCSISYRLDVAVKRRISRYATVGEPLRYKIVIRNKTNRKQTGLFIKDNLADPAPTYEEFLEVKVPGEKERNWLDRLLGYPKWIGLTAKNIKARTKEIPLPPISPRGEIEKEMEILPIKRGYMTLTSVSVARPDPFGLFKAFKNVPLPDTVLVLPKLYPIPVLNLPEGAKYQPGGMKLATSVGESEEFIALRDYQLGDSLRRIHWRSWAKVGKPVVKEYQDEYFVRHTIVLDTFTNTDYCQKFEEAVSVISSIALSYKTQDAILDLMFVGPQIYCFTTGRGISQVEKILQILATVQTCTDKSFETLKSSILERVSLLSSCICVFINWDEQRKDLVEKLANYNIPLIVLIITDSDSGDLIDSDSFRGKVEKFHQLKVGKVAEGLSQL